MSDDRLEVTFRTDAGEEIALGHRDTVEHADLGPLTVTGVSVDGAPSRVRFRIENATEDMHITFTERQLATMWGFELASTPTELYGSADDDEVIVTDGGSRTVWYAAQGKTGHSEVYHTDPDCLRLQNARKTHDTTEDQLRDRRSLCRTCAGGTDQSDHDWSYQEALKDAADEGRGIETDGGRSTKEVPTRHGTVEYETVECSSCGTEIKPEDAFGYFVSPDYRPDTVQTYLEEPNAVCVNSEVWKGYICEFCAESGPSGVPSTGKGEVDETTHTLGRLFDEIGDAIAWAMFGIGAVYSLGNFTEVEVTYVLGILFTVWAISKFAAIRRGVHDV